MDTPGMEWKIARIITSNFPTWQVAWASKSRSVRDFEEQGNHQVDNVSQKEN